MSGTVSGRCRLCGGAGIGLDFSSWIKETFTNHDLLFPGDSICHACQFCCTEADESFTRRVGKWWPTEAEAIAANPERVEVWRKKTKAGKTALPSSAADIKIDAYWNGWAIPQRIRNYSHFVVDGEWQPLSKGDKRRMADLLMQEPTVAVIADSGQKHIIFRARIGWWQFEEQKLTPCPALLSNLLKLIETLYQAGASKAEIESGHYTQKSISKIGIGIWKAQEKAIRSYRGGLPFQLAIFLAQKAQEDDTRTDSD